MPRVSGAIILFTGYDLRSNVSAIRYFFCLCHLLLSLCCDVFIFSAVLNYLINYTRRWEGTFLKILRFKTVHEPPLSVRHEISYSRVFCMHTLSHIGFTCFFLRTFWHFIFRNEKFGKVINSWSLYGFSQSVTFVMYFLQNTIIYRR